MNQPDDVRRLERRLAREQAARAEAETIAERVTADQFAAMNELMASRAVLDETPDFVAITDATGRSSYLNRALREMLGADACPTVHLADLLSPSSRETYEHEALPTLLEKGVWRGEFLLLRPDGGEIPVSQVLIAHTDEAGALRHISFVARDVTEQRDLTQMLAHRALHDALTGLPNRRLAYERLDHSLAKGSARHGQGLAVLFMDLDGFKAVNDTHGHEVGDRLLIAVAERLRILTRSTDTLARVGGDEFVVVCEPVAGLCAAEEIARDMIAAIAEPFDINAGSLTVGLSVGIAFTTRSDQSAEALVRRADLAMYDAKRAGKGTFASAELLPDPEESS